MAGDSIHRLTLRIGDKDYEKLKYWAERENLSVNEFVVRMLDFYVRAKNEDYDMVPLSLARQNQMIDMLTAFGQDLSSLMSIVVDGFGSLTNLTRGENYLLEPEDGEI